jgi:hypothetical protein
VAEVPEDVARAHIARSVRVLPLLSLVSLASCLLRVDEEVARAYNARSVRDTTVTPL